MTFKVGQQVTMFIKRSGLVSKQQHVVDEIVDEIVRLEDTIREFNLNGEWIDFANVVGSEYWIEVT
jgi:hypothetical protein